MTNFSPNVPPQYLEGLEDTPDEVKAIIRLEPREPESDPTLGIPVSVNRQGKPAHRLVTIGDSLTQGFQSGAIFNTSLSYPMLIARELGCSGQFRYPKYDSPGEGLPLNLEKLTKDLGDRFRVADGINAIDFAMILPWLRTYLDANEDYWEGRAKNSFQSPEKGLINHNLAMYGWDLRNTLSRTAKTAQDIILKNPFKDNDEFNSMRQVPEHANEIATLRVLNTARDKNGVALTPLGAAKALSQEGDGIETLIIAIGSNNALGSILTFKAVWSESDFYTDMSVNDRYTVWQPSHFKAELDLIVEQVKQIKARHVIWATVPHVTIPPFVKGINPGKEGKKVSPGSRYYPYYVPIWLDEEKFDVKRHPHLTANQARSIDSAIDKYNESIVDAVRQGRREGKDWYVFEMVSVLDRLAYKRYLAEEDRANRPSWWTAYDLPPALDKLNPKPDTRFFISDAKGRHQGGLFSLDGIHPTTIGYGIMAQEVIAIMQLAGVEFFNSRGERRTSPIKIDFARLIQEDSLISKPPTTIAAVLDFAGWLDSMTGFMSQMYKSNL
ncbi:hypothetical protein WA1_22630 [Scytonema hofmannii PCC 7110]|uniref:Lipase n=1 Tax=Scytonema hofmannii PCC 7110 TaxID=128403 RepID=A0A139X992_9CYAN|nr:hypothetical protein [Scytonema hofmannii]KYC41264.1 hypothetical protein WA1_22630 [Scytonema hofmannii PCC 7110]